MQVETGQAPPAGVTRAAAHEKPLADRRQTDRVQQIIILAILVLGALAMIVPFEWMLATSLSRSANSAMPRIPALWPADPSFFNYKISLSNLPVLRYYVNSLIVTTASTVGLLLFSYVVARLVLLVTAWAATAPGNERPVPLAPPAPAVLTHVVVRSGPAGVTAGAVGAAVVTFDSVMKLGRLVIMGARTLAEVALPRQSKLLAEGRGRAGLLKGGPS